MSRTLFSRRIRRKYYILYKINEKGETELYETTNVSLEYLPVEEQEKIKSGIEAIGQENLNQILENLES